MRYLLWLRVGCLPIQSLKLVCLIDVIVMTEHRHGEALAETAGADEEKVLIGSLHLFYKPCLIDIVAIVFAHSHEVHHTVWYALCLFFYSFFVHNQDDYIVRLQS